MKKTLIFLIGVILTLNFLYSEEKGFIPAFKLEKSDIQLERLAQPGTPFNKVGQRFALLGDESGSFEAWAYPLKLVRNFEFSFFTGNSTRPIKGRDIVHRITVSPWATTLTYTYQSFTVKAVYVTPVKEPGALILLHIDSSVPLTIVCGFLPVLQPMWPAGIGGQYAYWDQKTKAYVISEPTGNNHALVGSPAASALSYTPAHMLSDSPSEFQIEIKDPEEVKNRFIPLCVSGGSGKRAQVLEVYQKLLENPEYYYQKSREHFRNLSQKTLQIKTPNPKINLAYEWAKVTFDNLIVDNPELGKGMVAGLGASGTSGRPGFGWFFGGDAYINSFSMLSYGAHQEIKEILAFTQKWQREDGKMAHELSQSQGYIDWWENYPYGYIHGDTTPYFIAAMYDYMKISGDTDFIKQSWPSLIKAYNWCLSTDKNKDGLMDNSSAGLGALEYGALTGIETDIYLGAVWVRASQAMEEMSKILGKGDLQKKASLISQKAQKAFDEKFWDPENKFYAYAFNDKGERVKEISPWNAIGLMWDLGEKQRSLLSLEKLSSSELTTDWGIRSISCDSQYFQPLNYNYGAVWPFLTSWVTTALYKHHLPLNGYPLLLSTVHHTFDHALGCVTEVFSGTRNVWPQEAVPQQGFSTAGAVLPLIRGMIGLEANAIHKTITFAPHFPGNWKHVKIKGYKVGDSEFSFDYQRNQETITVNITPKKAQGFEMHLAPCLAQGTPVKQVTLNGKNIEYKTVHQNQVTQVEAKFSVNEDPLEVKLWIEPCFEILPVIPEIKVGEPDSGLKVISLYRKNQALTLKLEGISGKIYNLSVMHPEFIKKINGAEVESDQLIIKIPDDNPGEFITHKVHIELKDQ
ncbi:MAG TPA: GH116 family glycosyl hydrolase [Acidobacteriota bacterium]|nr:GH116 family glycosyl hydrolase [Acidobacteriota bacterium]